MLWALKGDAGQRALMAWSLGWPDAQQASGTAWMPFYLAGLMFDDYDAVRYIAYRSLKGSPGYGGIRFDHMKPAGHYDRIMDEVMQVWFRTVGEGKPTAGELLFTPEGMPRMDIYDNLRSQRDNRRVIITE